MNEQQAANSGTDRRLRIFISAAEMSGDRHAAGLIHAIRASCADEVEFIGVAGPRMQEAGCRAIDDWTRQSAMLVSAVGLVGQAWKLLGRVSALTTSEPFDLAVVVDSPALHLPMAKRLKKVGLPVMYYIAPQLWAWGQWRVGKLRRRVDHVATILPFEESFFTQRRIDATYVGHPLVEQFQALQTDATQVAAFQTLGQPVVACLPGSRKHVIEEVLPGQLEVAREIHETFPEACFLFPAATAEAEQTITDSLRQAKFRWQTAVGVNAEMLKAADLALVASGTATLEVAFHRLPMVVMYNGSKWGYKLIGRWLIKTPHLSLVNILAGKRIVPEFMPYYDSTAPIAQEALDLLQNASRRQEMEAELDSVISSLGDDQAATRAAALACDLANRQ